VKIRLAPDELWPLWNIDQDGDDLVDVDEVQCSRWTRVMQEFAEVQKEMQAAVDKALSSR